MALNRPLHECPQWVESRHGYRPDHHCLGYGGQVSEGCGKAKICASRQDKCRFGTGYEILFGEVGKESDNDDASQAEEEVAASPIAEEARAGVRNCPPLPLQLRARPRAIPVP